MRNQIIPAFLIAASTLTVSALMGQDQLVAIKRGTLTMTASGEGFADAVERTSVRSRFDSVLLWLIPEGTHVDEGMPVAEVDTSNLEGQRDVQQIVVEDARGRLASSERGVEIAELAVSEVDLEFRLATLEIELETAAARARLLRAREGGEDSEIQLAEKGLAVALLRTELTAVRAKRRRLESHRELELASANQRAREAELQQAELTLEELAEQCMHGTLVAPVSGTVIYASSDQSGRSLVEEGSVIRERQTILDIVDPDRLQVVSLIEEGQVDMLQAGSVAQVYWPSLKVTTVGEVARVSLFPEPAGRWDSDAPRMYRVLVALESTPSNVHLGLAVQVEFEAGKLADVLLAPRSAVFLLSGEAFCFVQAQGRKERRKLRIGAANDQQIVVLSGLLEGELVHSEPGIDR